MCSTPSGRGCCRGIKLTGQGPERPALCEEGVGHAPHGYGHRAGSCTRGKSAAVFAGSRIFISAEQPLLPTPAITAGLL